MVRRIVLGWAALAAIGTYRGCSSAALPPKPGAGELARVRAMHFPARVGVERYRYPVYSERLVSSLSRTHLFDAVDSLERLGTPELTARVERTVYGTATIPMWTVLTLGIVPTTVSEEWGEVFSLRRYGTETPAVGVDFTYAGPSTLGFAAAIRSLSPNVTTADPPKTSRFRDALSVAICSKSSEIEGLLRRP
jgi:hypothetical protein